MGLKNHRILSQAFSALDHWHKWRATGRFVCLRSKKDGTRRKKGGHSALSPAVISEHSCRNTTALSKILFYLLKLFFNLTTAKLPSTTDLSAEDEDSRYKADWSQRRVRPEIKIIQYIQS